VGRALLLPQLLLAAGCAGRSLPKNAGASGADVEVAALARLQAVRANFDRLEDLAGLINVTLDEAGEREHLGGTVLFRRPDLLRLEVMTPLGQAVATIVHRDGEVLVHDHRQERWWRSRADDRGVVEFFGLRFSVADWLAALRDGGVPDSAASDAGVVWDGRVCRFPQGAAVVELELDAERPVVRERRVIRDEKLVEEVFFERFQRQDGIEHASEIRASWPQERRRLTIRFRKKVLNRGVAVDRFNMEIPAGVTLRPTEGEVPNG
jgi:outer membrane lipoprotein-sorting protein